MKVVEKVSWLMGCVQENLFPHLNQCLKTPLTAQEERLVSILEIVRVERHVVKAVSRYRWPGRNAHDRQSLARAFVAKALYRHPTTSDLIRALNSAENLRKRKSKSRRRLTSEAVPPKASNEKSPALLRCGEKQTAGLPDFSPALKPRPQYRPTTF